MYIIDELMTCSIWYTTVGYDGCDGCDECDGSDGYDGVGGVDGNTKRFSRM